MSPRNLTLNATGVAFVFMLLIGCGAPAATPVPPTTTPTPAVTLATSVEQVVGTWQSGRYYIRFDADGTYRQAHVLEELASAPYAISSYQFEGSEMVTKAISVSGVPSCGEAIGRYNIRLLDSGHIRVVTIRDQCLPRAGDTAREYEPVR